jgi:hypothetical protein
VTAMQDRGAGAGERHEAAARAARPTSFCLAAGPLCGSPEGDFSVSNFHPDPIPGNLDENIFGVREVVGRERGGLFWATSLEKIIGGVTALMQQSSAVPRCAILSVGSTGGIGCETPRLHHASRRRGGVAARSARSSRRCRSSGL